MNFKDWFQFSISRPKRQVWPGTDHCKVKTRVSLKLLDSEKPKGTWHPFEIQANTILSLTRVPNPYGFPESWVVTDGMVIGAAESHWKDLVESGQVEII